MNKSDVYSILTYCVFWGGALRSDNSDPGEYGAILTPAQWDSVLATRKITPHILTSGH